MVSCRSTAFREVFEYHSFYFAYNTELLHDVIDTIYAVSIADICHADDLFDAFSLHFECRVIYARDSTLFRIADTLEIVYARFRIRRAYIRWIFEIAFLIFYEKSFFSFFFWYTSDKEIFQLLDAYIGSCRDRQSNMLACRLFEVFSHLFEHIRIDEICFREDYELFFLSHLFAPLLELTTDHTIGFDHFFLTRARVDEVDDDRTPVYMFEKFMTQSLSLTRTLDESWYVFDHE